MRGLHRTRLNTRLANTMNMDGKRKAERDILRTMPEFDAWVAKLDNCKPSRPCNLPMCDHCAGAGAENAHLGPDSKNYTNRNTGRGAKINYRNRGGDWLLAPFLEFDTDNLHAFTINFRICAKDCDPKLTKASVQREFRYFLDQHMPDAIARMTLDVAVCTGPKSRLGYPERHVDPDIIDGDFWMKFHGHGIIWHPLLGKHDIAKRMRGFYPGPNRVAFSKRYDLDNTADGFEVGGLKGWGEYAAMEKTELALPDGDQENDNVAAFQHLARLRLAWPRQSRRITYGTHKGRGQRNRTLKGITTATSVDVDDADCLRDVSGSNCTYAAPSDDRFFISIFIGNGGALRNPTKDIGIRGLVEPLLSHLTAPHNVRKPP